MKGPYCHICGKPNTTVAQFCRHCGTPLSPLPVSEPVSRSGTPAYAYVIIGVLMLLIGATAITLIIFGTRLIAEGSDRDESTVIVADIPTESTPEADPLPSPSPSSTTRPLPEATPTPTSQPTATNTRLPTETPKPIVTPVSDHGPETLIIGRSLLNQPIEVLRVGSGPRRVLFVGGIHAGHSPSSVALAEQAAGYFGAAPTLVPAEATLYILLSLNPDSPEEVGLRAGRLNANGVDLNRNWDCEWTQDADIEGHIVPGSGGSAPFSEPETRALRDFILSNSIDAVIFWEARVLNGFVSPGGCHLRTSVSEGLAQTYGRAAGYPVGAYEEIDRPIPGDASNWLDSQGIPAIFVLLPNFRTVDWSNHLAAILAVLTE